jgi:hypothetical protein
VVTLDDGRALTVAALDRIGETVLDARVDLELAKPPTYELALDRGEERPDQPTSAVGRVDEDIEQSCATLGPRGSGDRETDQGRPVPRRADDGIAVRDLPAHLAL